MFQHIAQWLPVSIQHRVIIQQGALQLCIPGLIAAGIAITDTGAVRALPLVEQHNTPEFAAAPVQIMHGDDGCQLAALRMAVKLHMPTVLAAVFITVAA
ncbi:hypothetical protein [Kerstersia gyiorum]|uniref:hypothetical protein n=1 Tax=Kerstersia gyiorum TaxID=206506 RepID=UPI00209CE7E0|nr:hypothetical protein [Kerstersia gyiorum]MCP1632636.1 hypothetical protein [Kerstersia gyiorum]MCP1635833.1 hypothetical protein [Kerstersia gyiorum]MCP1670758.1 hypothetical protein [Kerstersia gyiorum]MCP1678587.1 hypothetical protein [Kerstersia gyiorum]MCP1682386.1 hypothetical protein [Kerstersia gyiorum]